jgi:DnaJ-domain-containing protein 1
MTLSEGAVILFGLFAGYWVVSKLFFRPPTAQQRPQAVPPQPPSTAPKQSEWSEVLQVSPSAPIAEIRAAYKLLISKYHPDKVDNLGQELKDLAEHKTQEITVAYREAMRARGEPP